MIRRPGVVLALLTGLNLLNYIDRFVLSAVLPPIQRELGLSNGVAGLLATAFLLGYFVTSPAFGALADRGKRTGLIAFGIVVWSLATMASGMATGTVSLVLARVAVGVGEASYATIAPTIIDDLAPAEKKSTWLAIFYAAIPVGSALGFVIGGLVEKQWGWRTAFFVAGGPGLALAALCMFMVDPPRGEVAKKGPILETVRPLLRIPLYIRSVLGYAAFTFAVGGFGYWGPTYLVRRFGDAGLSLASANLGMGLVTVLGGALGTAIGGVMGDRAVRPAPADGDPTPYRSAPASPTPPVDPAAEARDTERRVSMLLRVCALGSAIGAPLSFLAFFAWSPLTFFVAFFLAEVAIFLSTSPVNAAILASVPPQIRASAMAVSIFGVHLLGDLWSPPGVGVLADLTSLSLAMLILPFAVLLSAVIWFRPAEPRSALAGAK
jgi:MFS transporter, Spinster family, sphingosine-1-phosphate transporter